MTKRTNIKKISITAALCALAYLCMFVFKFKVNFLTFDFKDAILAVIAFLYGPVYGVLSALVVGLTEFVTVSDTGVYGLLMNFISSAAFAGTCGIIYKYKRKISGAVMGCVFAVLVMTAIMLVANIFITPFYMSVPRDAIERMLPTTFLPFNLIKYGINSCLALLIYKPVVTAMRKSHIIESTSPPKARPRLWITIITAFVLVSLVFCLLILAEVI